MFQKKLDPLEYDFEVDFSPPPALAPLLLAFSREVIRFAPVEIFGFALEYFSSQVAEGSPDRFLKKQTKFAEEKQKIQETEKKEQKKSNRKKQQRRRRLLRRGRGRRRKKDEPTLRSLCFCVRSSFQFNNPFHQTKKFQKKYRDCTCGLLRVEKKGAKWLLCGGAIALLLRAELRAGSIRGARAGRILIAGLGAAGSRCLLRRHVPAAAGARRRSRWRSPRVMERFW